MSRIFFLITILISISISGCSLTARQNVAVPAESENASTQKFATITLNDIPVQVEVMRTPEEKAKGLSGRAGLEEGKGMLFVFDPPSLPSFWMKEMQFPIDIIWIYNDKVIDVTSNVPAPVDSRSSLPTYSPPSFVTHVLEVPAGWTEKYNIKEGAYISDNII